MVNKKKSEETKSIAKKSSAKAKTKSTAKAVAKKSVNTPKSVRKMAAKKPVKKTSTAVKSLKKSAKSNIAPKKTVGMGAAPLFMMAQLPFNKDEAVELNTPMIDIMDDAGNVVVAKNNLRKLGVWDDILRPNKTFLEIGCGSGYLLEEMYKEGDGFYLGLDPIASEVAKAKKRLAPYFLQKKDKMKAFSKVVAKKKSKSGKKEKVVPFSTQSLVTHCLLEEVVYPTASIDYLYSYHVFEHLENPLKMFDKAKEWLSPQGRLIITCPNVEGALFQGDLEKWRCALTSHRWLPGVKTVTRAARHCGFLVEKCFTYGGFPAPRTVLQNVRNWRYKKTGKGDVLCMIFRRERS